MKLISSLFMAALVAAAGPASADSITDADRRGIQTVLDSYERALNASDVDAVVALYADDGVFMPSSAPTAVGIEGVRATYEFPSCGAEDESSAKRYSTSLCRRAISTRAA